MPSNATENAAAVAVVIIANWLISHLANSWAMPSEVQSAAQALIVVSLGGWFKARWTAAQAATPMPTSADIVTSTPTAKQ